MYPITSRFLQQESFRSHGHSGIDFSMAKNTPLRSIKDGVITRITDFGDINAGKTIFVEWEDGKVAIYGHLNKFNPNIHVGDKVKVGDLLGFSGNSGHVVGKNGGYHLHFGIKEGGKFIDPSSYIEQIQNMNNPDLLQNLAQTKIPEITQKSHSLFDLFTLQSDIYSNFFNSLKLNIINISNLFDYSIFMQYFENIIKVFS